MMDFDFIVVGSGFGGSVSAHRLTEKGYRVGVMEMGRRWTPQNLPTTNWKIWNWIWRPGLGLRGFFNIDPFRHVLIMHGCAVGGGSITYANTLLVPGRGNLGKRIVGRPGGLEGGDAAALRDRDPHVGSHRKPDHGSGGQHPGAGGGRARGGEDLLSHESCRLRRAGRRSSGADVSRPLLRRRGAGAHQLHRLRRLHDGMPLRREEHAGPELPLSGREGRARGSSPRPKWWMSGRWRAAPTGAMGTRCSRCPPRWHPADAAASRAAAWSSRPRRWARWTFCSG